MYTHMYMYIYVCGGKYIYIHVCSYIHVSYVLSIFK